MARFLIAGMAILAACAQATAAPKARKPQPASSIEIHNQRDVALESFTIATMAAQDKPVAQLDKPLAPGAKTRLRLTKAKGCEYMARWKFEDAGDEGQVDLCRDVKIVLTD